MEELDSEDNTVMANDYLKKKWAEGFKANDLDKDGFISMDDANTFLGRFTKLHKIEGETARKLEVYFREVWNSIFLFDQEKISEEEYIEKMAQEYNTKYTKFCKRVDGYMGALSDIYDVNHDGYLSEEEYVITLKCHGLECLDRKYLEAYPQRTPGYVDLVDFKNSWCAYMINADENDTKLERPCLMGFNVVPRD